MNKSNRTSIITCNYTARIYLTVYFGVCECYSRPLQLTPPFPVTLNVCVRLRIPCDKKQWCIYRASLHLTVYEKKYIDINIQ